MFMFDCAELIEGQNSRIGHGIDYGADLKEGPGITMGDGLELAEGPGVGTGDGADGIFA